jgi:hypothetical protein
MRSRSHVLVVLALVTAGLLAAACSSSAPKASSSFDKGLTLFYTPSGAQAPTIPSSFSGCVYGKSTAADRAVLSKVTSQNDLNDMADAVGVRITRSSNACDASLTAQLVEAEAFAGAPSSISASEKSCITTKAIDAIVAIDDTKLSGSNSKTVQDAVTNAAKACGVTLPG